MKDVAEAREFSLIGLVKLSAWSALMAPIGIVLHELGHYFAARLLSFPAQLNAASVSGGAQLGRDPDWMVAVQSGTGPFVTVAIVLFAAYHLRRRPGRRWALALAATAPLRFLLGGSYLMLAAYIWWVEGTMGGADFDEAKVALALDVALPPVLALQMLLLVGFWAWLIKTIPPGKRILSLVAMLAGAFPAIGLWMAVGPTLFRLA